MSVLILNEGLQQLSDDEIIKRINAGEKELFELVMRRYNSRLYRIAMSIVNNDEEIEDIMQNAYIKAYQNLSAFEGRSSFGTWLVRILINESLASLKRSKRFISFESNKESSMKTADHALTADKQNPANITLNRELIKAFENALLELPEKYRMVFVMREMENMSIAETAEALELNESNVKVRLNRAKAMLREKLNNFYKTDFVFHFYLTRCDRIVTNVLGSLGLTK
jgi:RNA polymerase sigma factor (sigma-70 family)